MFVKPSMIPNLYPSQGPVIVKYKFDIVDSFHSDTHCALVAFQI